MTIATDAKIYIAGHKGMVGSALLRLLTAKGYDNLLVATRDQVDLTNQAQVGNFFYQHQPDYVFLAAAKVGGIHANSIYPAEFIYQNLMIQNNVIQAAYQANVNRLLFLGSSCIYPKQAQQPMQESALLTGLLEPTNEPYAIAKIAGIKLCESYNRQFGTDYRSIMPTNLYGPGDNYHPTNSHVLPALLRRFHDAKVRREPEVLVWGSGQPKREFLHVDDMASASWHVMTLNKAEWKSAVTPMCSHINVGYGDDISIADLASQIAKVVGYTGSIKFDPTKPDGTMRKLLDSDLLTSLGWQPSITMEQGMADTYQNYLRDQQDTQ